MTAPLTLADLLAPVQGTPLAEELTAIRGALAGGRRRVYLVGGLVRDLLLGRSSRDIDLAVAGPVEDLAPRLAAALGGAPRFHRPFMTATLETRRGFRVDLARLRRERYREPATLPEVAPGSLGEDLARRDFTVNAMAVDLERSGSRLIDFHDGFEDLAAGLLRILHPASFIDDPTRVLRGLRLENEIGLRFEEETRERAAAPETAAALARVSGFRLWRELRPCLRDLATARRSVAALAELGLLAAIDPRLALEPLAAPQRGGPAAGAIEVLRRWSAPLGRPERWELAERLALSREERLAIGVRPLAGRADAR